MPVIDRIKDFQNDLVAIRRDIHAHPEIGFEETRTSAIVADLLETWGITVHRGVGGTGVVGELRGNHNSNKRIGLRADMDALPILETTGLPYASTVPGKMHACGHDGHTTMLLGAARYLAETRNFAGTAVFVFQPAEEGLGGARAMIKDNLFTRFPCDEIYGLHNSPNGKPGRIAVFPGSMYPEGRAFRMCTIVVPWSDMQANANFRFPNISVHVPRHRSWIFCLSRMSTPIT